MPGDAGFDQHEFNLQRWEGLCEDRFLASLDYRIETDHLGQIIMTPPPGPSHGEYQSEIGYLFRLHFPPGRCITECPISTTGGVKAADFAWISKDRSAESEDRSCFRIAPEICVEVLSPSNSKVEIAEKKRLYFEAGANEVWICDREGKLRFFTGSEVEVEQSPMCPEFPGVIELP